MFEWRFQWKERASYERDLRNTAFLGEEQQGRGFSDGNKLAGRAAAEKKASMMGVPAPQEVWEKVWDPGRSRTCWVLSI